MRASIKLLLWLVGGTGALLVALVVLLLFIDVSLYRTQIENHASRAFGRAVVLEGPLGLEPSLTPRLAVKGLKIANPDWASRPFLAMVDKFAIRVGLLPLLRGELEIMWLEFHGVDLLLERGPDGANNFTFGTSDEPAALPAIEHMALSDVTVAYAAAEGPLRRLHLQRLTARKVPNQPLELDMQAEVNTLPVTLSLRGEPPSDSQPGPWQITLRGEAGDLSLRIAGSMADPSDWRQGEYRLDLKGPRLKTLEALSDYPLPEVQPFALSTNIDFKLDEYLTVTDLAARLGNSDIQGELRWDMATRPSAIKARFDSQRLDATELGIAEPPSTDADPADTPAWKQPLAIGALSAFDLAIDVEVERLEGLPRPVKNFVLSAQADREDLRLATLKATVDDTQIAAEATLPWGEQLATPASGVATLQTLLQRAELDIRAQAADGIHQYATALMGRPLDLSVSSLQATARLGTPLTIRAEAALNDQPLTATLEAEPLAVLLQHPTGPWRSLSLAVHGDELQLEASGSVAQPLQIAGFAVNYAFSGNDIGALLPLQGTFSLSGHYADGPHRHLFDELKLTLGRSDIGGRITVHRDGQRYKLVARLDARRIHIDDLQPVNTTQTRAGDDRKQPLASEGLDALDLDVEAKVRRLEGLAKPVQDISLTAQSSGKTLTVAPIEATVDDTRVDARLALPWGERLTALGEGGISLQRLAPQAEFSLQAQPPAGRLLYPITLLNHPIDLALSDLKASARPGEALQLSAKALLEDTPLELNLRAEPLAALLRRPNGPWRDLALEVRGDDQRLQVTGSVERPLEARGFDARYSLRGEQIEALLPLFDLILPFAGPYSLTGRFADLPDRLVFDDLKIESGGSDIGGRISVYQGQQRPRVVAQLNSEQIYLRKLLPASETETTADKPQRVIPDYDLPIEALRTIDGELEFKGKRLRTDAGDLGDISFRATLKDSVFRLDPFRVRGWAGALVESELEIDASQNPPLNTLRWIARQLNYGVLLEQAGLAETVEGTLDITLRLAGSGRSRREFLGDATGQLIIVGQEGRFGSRRLDLWGSDLATIMLSREWRREDVTRINCLVARINIENGLASSDELLIDTRRITIAGAGTLDLESEELNLILAPRPDRASLISLTNPVRVTGTITAPQVEATVLPRRRMAAAGTGALAGLINPGYLIFTFTQLGSGGANACNAAVERAMKMKGNLDQPDDQPAQARRQFSLFPGCTRSAPRPVE